MTVLATFARMYVNDLDAAITDLEACGVTGVRLRFGHAAGLQLALVGNVLVLAADDETLKPFRATDLTVIVDELEEALAAARSGGAVMVRPTTAQATGRNATVTLPAGPTVEFVEWDLPTRSTVGV